MRRFLDRLDTVLGRVLARVLGTLCLLAGLGSLVMGVVMYRDLGLTWGLLLPATGAGVFTWIGQWLWRVKRRLSEYDWSV